MREFESPAHVGKVAALLLLAGCTPEPPPIDEPDPIELEIARAMAATARANASVADLEKSLAGLQTDSNAAMDSNSAESDDMQIDWNGPLEPLLDSVARLAGYSVVISGTPPVNHVTVAVTEFNGTPAEAIQAVDRATFGFARITANRESREIKLEYPD